MCKYRCGSPGQLTKHSKAAHGEVSGATKKQNKDNQDESNENVAPSADTVSGDLLAPSSEVITKTDAPTPKSGRGLKAVSNAGA